MMDAPEEDVVGHYFRDIWPEEIRSAIDGYVGRVLSGQTCSFQASRMDGNEIGWWDVSLGPVFGKDSTVEKFIAISTSITERKRAEEKLKLTQFAIDNAADSIYWVDPDSRFLYVNDAACISLGYTREELLSMKVGDINPNFSSIDWTEHWQKMKQKKSVTFESVHRTKGGMIFPVEVTVNHIDHGDKEYHCTFIRDITERKLTEKETTRAAQLASVGEMAAGVAFEINNPLNGIINYAEMLASKVRDEKQKEIANRLIMESDRISRVVRSLLSFTRREDSKTQPVQVKDILSEVMDLVSSQLEKLGIEVSEDFSPNLPYIRVAPQLIEHVFLGIIANARDAIKGKQYSASEKKSIDIGGRTVTIDGKDFVEVSFEDNGAGMSADVMVRAMVPFFSTKGRKGTGLGLSVSQSIVHDHGGKIDIESEEGKFTKVTIHLPAGRGEETA